MTDYQTGPIASQWDSDDGERSQILDRARLCASLVDPSLLPPRGQTAETKLPENYQSVGTQGLLNMEGKFLDSIFPPGFPFFHLEVPPEIKYAKDANPADLQRAAGHLFVRELAMHAVLESANLSGPGDRGGKMGFRTAKRMAMAQILATGETLEQLTEDYRLKVFGRDMYVTRRDPCGDVAYHIIKEQVDPLTLTDETLAKASIKRNVVGKKPHKERCCDLYTMVEWKPTPTVGEPQKGYWLIRQELNGKTVTSVKETYSPFFCTYFRIAPKEHYGRGFVELNLGDLRTLDTAQQRLLELFNLMTMGKIARGHQSEVRDEDLKIESGRIVNCDVRGGVVQDLALLKFDGVPEASALSQAIQVMTARLGKAMLLESESQPKGERVTAYQVDRIAQEIRGITGGANVSITEMQIPPLLRRLTYQMERDKLLAPLPKEAVKFTLVTGSAAMARAARAGGVLDFVNACVALGDAALARINQGVLVDVLARYKGVDEPGLIKSDEQMAQEQQAALAQQAAQAAIGQAIASTGKIAEQQANQGGSPLGA